MSCIPPISLDFRAFQIALGRSVAHDLAHGEDATNCYIKLRPTFEPRKMPDEPRAKTPARMLKDQNAGVIAWLRSADLMNGVIGELEIIPQYGEVPEME